MTYDDAVALDSTDVKTIFPGVIKKINGGNAYYYWDPENENLPYEAKLHDSLTMWGTFSGFDDGGTPFYIEFIAVLDDGSPEDTICGYIIKDAPSVNSKYIEALNRFDTPFRFYTDIETTYKRDWFKLRWLYAYKQLITTLKDNGFYHAFMSLDNLVVYNDKIFYSWLFDSEHATDENRTPSAHLQMEEMVNQKIDSPSFLDTVLGLINADIAELES